MVRRVSLPLLMLAACSSSASTSPHATNNPDAGTTTPILSSNDAAPATTDAGAPEGGAVTDGGEEAAVVDLAPYRIIGRYDTGDAAGPMFGWSGTQLRARFHGTSISIDLGDNYAEDQFDVSIDGAAPTLLVATDNRKTYTLATGLTDADHELVMTKRTESTVGIAQLFALNATLIGTPGLPAGTRRIEMIGDSITNGYGVLGTAPCEFSPATEDESFAWGALAASQLNAVHTAIAWSGIGLYRNYDETTTGTMPDVYGLAVATDPTSTWTPSGFEPDVVVVNLGTNDFSNQSGTSDPGPNFQSTLITFLTTIRGAHPNAKIILATSPMLPQPSHGQQLAYLQGAMQARNAAGDTAISILDLAIQSASDGYGCNDHPDKTTHQKMATALVTQIKSVTGWQ